MRISLKIVVALIVLSASFLIFRSNSFVSSVASNIGNRSLVHALDSGLSSSLINASEWFDKSINSKPIEDIGCFGRWITWIELEEMSKAKSLIEENTCNSFFPQRREVMAYWVLNHADALINQGLISQADNLYDLGLTLDVFSADMYSGKARLYSLWNKPDEAIFYYSEAIKTAPDRTAKYMYKIGLEYFKNNLTDLAKHSFEKALSAANQNMESQFYLYDHANSLYLLGQIAMREGNYVIANEYYELVRVVDLDGNTDLPFWSLIRQGEILETTQNYGLAKQYYLSALELTNNSVQKSRAYLALALIYKQKSQWVQAVKYLQEAINLNPDYDWAYLELARIWKSQGRCEDAQHVFVKLVEIKSDDEYGQDDLDSFMRSCNPDSLSIERLDPD